MKAKNFICRCAAVREAEVNGQSFKVGRIEADGSTTLNLALSRYYLLRWYVTAAGRDSYREYRLPSKSDGAFLRNKSQKLDDDDL